MTGRPTGGGGTVERAVRWERSRLRHQDALRAAGILPRRARQRLRYVCLTPAGPLVRAAALLVIAGYFGWALLGHATGAGVLRVVALALLVVVLATNRASVSEAGLSFDVIGIRQVTTFGFVPLWAIQEVGRGRRPVGWPRSRAHGGPWPGRRRVHVRYTDQYGQDRARSAWVRDPERYAEAIRGGPADHAGKRRSRGSRS
jgi:hypothetical protein